MASVAIIIFPALILFPGKKIFHQNTIPELPTELPEPSDELLVYEPTGIERYRISDEDLKILLNDDSIMGIERKRPNALRVVAQNPDDVVTLPDGTQVRIVGILTDIPIHYKIDEEGNNIIEREKTYSKPSGEILPEGFKPWFDEEKEFKDYPNRPEINIGILTEVSGPQKYRNHQTEIWEVDRDFKIGYNHSYSTGAYKDKKHYDYELKNQPIYRNRPLYFEKLFEDGGVPLVFDSIEPGTKATFEGETWKIKRSIIREKDGTYTEWTESGKKPNYIYDISLYEPYNAKMIIEFDRPFPGEPDIWNYYVNDGSRTGYGMSRITETVYSVNKLDLEKFDNITVQMNEHYRRVVWEITNLPGLKNFKGNLMDMEVPAILFRSKHNIQICGLLEWHNVYGGNTDNDLIAPEKKWIKIGDFFKLADKNVPNNYSEYAYLVHNGRLIKTLLSGKMRQNFMPKWNLYRSYLESKRLAVTLALIILVCSRFGLSIHAYQLGSKLRQLGYREFKFRHYQLLMLAIGQISQKIPPRDEAELIPGVDTTNPRSLIRLMESLNS